jgi:hypothetical protein
MGGNMNRPRAADDFAIIRARIEELRREREAAQAAESDFQSDLPMRSNRNAYWPQREVSASPRINSAPLAEAPFLDGTHLRIREFGFDLLQHPRLGDGGREEGSV